MLPRQAKVLSAAQIRGLLSYLETTRHPLRNRLILLLSVKAGLRAKEIALLSWSMVSDPEGNLLDHIRLEDRAAKGRSGGIIPINRELRDALADWKRTCPAGSGSNRVILTERARSTNAQMIVNLFGDWYRRLGYEGCSSHSGRRTFITNVARKISTVGGSMRDVQMLARHASLSMTQRYIDADVEAQRKVVELV